MQTSKLIPSKLTVVATIVFFLFLIIVQQSCKKTQNAFANEPIQDTAVGFFKLSPGTGSPVQKVARALQQQNNTKEFITAFAKNEGFAIWDKALVSVSKTADTADTTVILPLVKKDSQYVQGFIYAKLKGTVNLYLYRNSDYRGLPYKSAATAAKSYTAEKFALLMMRLDRQVFGNTMFQVKDPLLFGDKRQTAGGGKIIRIVYFGNDKKNAGTQNFIQTECVTVTTTSTYIASLHCTQTGKCSGGICDMCDLCVSYGTNTTSSTHCDSWDDGQGPFPQGGGSSPGGGNSPCGPTPRRPYITTSFVPTKCDPIPNPWPTVPAYNPLQPFDNLDIPVNAPDDPVIHNGIILSDTPHIFQHQITPKIIGKTVKRNNTEDMQYGTNGNASGITPANLSGLSNADLITSMKGLFYVCTFFDNELKAVGDKMIQKFADKTGGTFSDPVLNKKVEQSSAFATFLKKFGKELNNELKASNGDIDKVSTITLRLDIRPVFNGFYNKFHGLQILINDTEYTEISLDNFEIGPREAWAAEVTVTIHDHFGLDKNDALKYQGWSSGFPSWWILQHMRGLAPF